MTSRQVSSAREREALERKEKGESGKRESGKAKRLCRASRITNDDWRPAQVFKLNVFSLICSSRQIIEERRLTSSNYKVFYCGSRVCDLWRRNCDPDVTVPKRASVFIGKKRFVINLKYETLRSVTFHPSYCNLLEISIWKCLLKGKKGLNLPL